MTIYSRLTAYQDVPYRSFQSRLVPNIPLENIIGVRTPDMRRIAKELFGTDEGSLFLRSLPHQYYEENLVHFFMIAMIKEFSECVSAVECFLPYIDCWPVSDQASPSAFRKNHDGLIPFVKKWIDSNHVYTARFGIRMLMNEFLEGDFQPEYLEWVAQKQGDDYYLKMMVAWFFATSLVKRYEESLPYIESRRLAPWTHQKAIQKALESFRIPQEHKDYLKKLR